MLTVEHVTKKYDTRVIIEDIDLCLHEGETVSLLGVSGAGKTTLFNIIAGLITPDGGRVMLGDEDITGRPGRISYMLQKDLLFQHKKVIDNVTLPLVIRGVKRQEARETAQPYFEQFGIEGTQYQYPDKLSGGMRQRAALLRTYMASEGVVLLDEPFSALDTLTKTDMHRWYLDIMSRIELSTLFITHDIDEAILLSDRMYILSDSYAGDTGGARSPSRITAEIEIDAPGARDDSFALSTRFLEYKRRIISHL